MSKLIIPICLFTLMISLNSELESQPIEIGKVNWLRDFEKAQVKAQEKSKPIFVLFQEVPGCSTCQQVGGFVLSHPLIVEAIEAYFVPLVIYNNKKGKDKIVLAKYDEPSWNNPVARILNPDGESEGRLNGKYDIYNWASFIRKGIVQQGLLPPPYLSLVIEESIAGKEETAYFEMACFWTGEATLANLPGIQSTVPGFIGNKEVVRVRFNANLNKQKGLVLFANENKLKMADGNPNRFIPDHTPKYYLAQSMFRFVPLTSLQQIKVNSALGKGISPHEFLSPRQLLWLQDIVDNKVEKKNKIGTDILEEWWRF